MCAVGNKFASPLLLVLIPSVAPATEAAPAAYPSNIVPFTPPSLNNVYLCAFLLESNIKWYWQFSALTVVVLPPSYYEIPIIVYPVICFLRCEIDCSSIFLSSIGVAVFGSIILVSMWVLVAWPVLMCNPWAPLMLWTPCASA